MLRICRRDYALCVIGNEFPCRQPHNPSATLLRGLSTLPQGCFLCFLFLITFTIRQQCITYLQQRNQRDGSFGMPLAYTNQKNRPFGLWFMWFAWNQACYSTNDRCEALASLKGCILCFCFSSPVSPSSLPLRWGNLQVQMLGETEQSAI